MTVNVSDWSEVPASNASVDSVNVSESCPPGGINNAIRAVMAGVKTFYTAHLALVTTVSGKLSASGAVFTGTQPTYTGEGALLHHVDAANTSARVSILATGAALPSSPGNGDIVLYFTP